MSMGFWAARKALMVARNAASVLAVEALAALQGLHLLEPLQPSKALRPVVGGARSAFPPLASDRFIQPEIEAMAGWLGEGRLGALAGLLTGVSGRGP